MVLTPDHCQAVVMPSHEQAGKTAFLWTLKGSAKMLLMHSAVVLGLPSACRSGQLLQGSALGPALPIIHFSPSLNLSGDNSGTRGWRVIENLLSLCAGSAYHDS